MSTPPGEPIDVVLPDERATIQLGADIAMALRAGDLVELAGDLGAGKTTLARALIRALLDAPAAEVPSPTFTLVQTYGGRLPITHADLYRLADPSEVDELGLAEALSDGIALVEWPDNGGDRLPGNAIRVELSDDQAGRRARITGHTAGLARIARSLDIRSFIERSDRRDAMRSFLTGDASARSYEVVTSAGGAAEILMNSPPLVLGPVVRDGKAYAELARLSRTVHAFVGVDRVLASVGVTVPEIHATDLDAGLLLISHLGSGSFLDGGAPVRERYEAAAQLLARLHGVEWPRAVGVSDNHIHAIPPFDRDAMIVEVELLAEWYLPEINGAGAGEAFRAEFRELWNQALDRLQGGEESLVLRDFHSPNIIWRPDRLGEERLGIIDFQDAMFGPSAYDVASLAMDARVTIARDLEQQTVAAYVRARQVAGAFDELAFREAYAIMAAQRNSKILGIFVRLWRRDGKPGYIQHLPRIRDYVARALSHPSLADLRAFYLRHGLIEASA